MGEAGCPSLEQLAAFAGAGESDGGDGWVKDQCFADGVLVAVEEGEDAFGKAAGGYGTLYRLADELRGAGVGWMGFDDDGATGGEGRRGVAPGDREGEGEIRTAKDGDGTEGHAQSS